LHRDAVEGKLRSKRKNRGVGLSDDSDDDDDDDEHDRARRRKMLKKRRIAGDTLDDLGASSQLSVNVFLLTKLVGQNEETRAFYDAYHQPLTEDDGFEFQYLQRDDADVQDDDPEQESREVVSTYEIRRLVREAAQQNEVRVASYGVNRADKQPLLRSRTASMPKTSLGQMARSPTRANCASTSKTLPSHQRGPPHGDRWAI
jgi:hypothetical protein